MKQLIKLHLSFGQFLFAELFKKKSSTEKVKTIGKALQQYGVYVLRSYRLLFAQFDPDFKKAKKDMEDRKKLYTRFNEVISALTWIDKELHRQGLSRLEIRQFFRDFHKQETRRKEIVDNLLKNYKLTL